jgi:hypothetical protein
MHFFMRQASARALVAAVGGLITATNLACTQPLQPEVLFTFPNAPSTPYRNLIQGSDGNFYGTANGAEGAGVIYRLRRGVSLQSFGMTTNGFQLNTLNVGGSGWVVLESSSDLVHWTPIQTNGTAAARQFLDPAALTHAHQFYRVHQQ